MFPELGDRLEVELRRAVPGPTFFHRLERRLGRVEPAGLAQLSATVAATGLPVLAIGGITEATLRDVAGTGAAGVAAIGFLTGESVEELCRRVHLVRKAFDTLWPQVP